MNSSPLQSLTPQRLMRVSLGVAALTILLKTTAWHLTGSVGLLSDAMESVVNLTGALFGLLMVTIAERPADEDHPYGHHKAEYFSSGFEGALIVVAAIAIILAAVHRMFNPQPLEQLGWGLALSVLSSAFNGLLAWILLRAAKAHRSIALEANGKHLITDIWTSAGVVLGMVVLALTGWHWLDALVAMGVALNILREGGRLVWRSSQGLMDEAVEPAVLADIVMTLNTFKPRAVRVDHLITRQSGQRRYADLHLHLPANISLGSAAALRAEVEQALVAAVPGLRPTIQLLPDNVEPLPDAHIDLANHV